MVLRINGLNRFGTILLNNLKNLPSPSFCVNLWGNAECRIMNAELMYRCAIIFDNVPKAHLHWSFDIDPHPHLFVSTKLETGTRN